MQRVTILNNQFIHSTNYQVPGIMLGFWEAKLITGFVGGVFSFYQWWMWKSVRKSLID
jgi:hypothetical protein